jgi:hypothetical protein
MRCCVLQLIRQNQQACSSSEAAPNAKAQHSKHYLAGYAHFLVPMCRSLLHHAIRCWSATCTPRSVAAW